MTWDAIVIGSGFGGAMAAYPLVHAGQRVLMLERGGWVERGPDNWGPRGPGLVSAHYTMESGYDVTAGARRYRAGAWNCIGGQSVFYAGASYRYRESDFSPNAEVLGDSGAEWPFGYDDLEPFYAQAEWLLGVAGAEREEPTEPWRSAPLPYQPPPLSQPAQSIADAARRLGLTPSRIPLAINSVPDALRRTCVRCGTCDGYACAIGAKNDLATCIIPALIREGMALRDGTVCVKLLREGSRIVGVEYVDRITGERGRFHAATVLVAAGALATPHLLLASDLARVNPAAHAVGRYLMRHGNAVVLGFHTRQPNPERVFERQVAIFDLYDRAGCIQQQAVPLGLVRMVLPPGLRGAGKRLLAHAAALLVIGEDEPCLENGVTVDWTRTDRFGLPRLRVRHAHTARDERATALLVRLAQRVLRASGALLTWTYRPRTFTHAMGTVRMGVDARTSPLDAEGRYRGLDNLHVVDASALPRSAGVNPSLTIAANALRIGTLLARAATDGPHHLARALPVADSTA